MKEKEKEKDQISLEIMSVVHSHPPSHNISIIISMTLLDIKDDSLTCEKNKFTLSPTASIAPRSFLGPPLRRTPKIQQNHVTLPSQNENSRLGKSRTLPSCQTDFLPPICSRKSQIWNPKFLENGGRSESDIFNTKPLLANAFSEPTVSRWSFGGI